MVAASDGVRLRNQQRPSERHGVEQLIWLCVHVTRLAVDLPGYRRLIIRFSPRVVPR
jgi:hypothetical protein